MSKKKTAVAVTSLEGDHDRSRCKQKKKSKNSRVFLGEFSGGVNNSSGVNISSASQGGANDSSESHGGGDSSASLGVVSGGAAGGQGPKPCPSSACSE